MKIYLDLIFMINFFFDSLLLLTVKVVLKRNIKIKRIIIGGIIGGFSTFLLLIKLNNITLFLFKVVISILMILITFGYQNIKYTLKNLGYLYIISIILGGFLYLLNIEFSYKSDGIIFYHNGLSINFILMIILSPIAIYLYIKQSRDLKNNYSYYHKVNIKYNKKNIDITGFLDTGNKLKDPYMGIPIIIVNKDIFDEKEINDYILVPLNTINNNSMLKCIKVDSIYIDGNKLNKKALIGLSPNKINIDGISCIFGVSILEG